MFGVDSGELLLIVLVAVVVIGPKDLPRVMRTIGQWVARARGMASQFRMGVDEMVRDSEISDLETKWREQNEAIMKAHPTAAPDEPSFAPSAQQPAGSDWGLGAGGDASAVSLSKPQHRAAPAPPVGSLPDKPVRARLDKDNAAPVSSAPQLLKPPVPSSPGRRPPRSAPQLP